VSTTNGTGAAAATLGFVLCIENNGIRDQALLLCESIRRYGGRYRNGPIVAFAPRPGLGVDAETRARLVDLAVEYVDEPLNTTCLTYAPANRVFAGAYAERHSRSDFLAVLDSDTVWLDEPELPENADVGVRVRSSSMRRSTRACVPIRAPATTSTRRRATSGNRAANIGDRARRR